MTTAAVFHPFFEEPAASAPNHDFAWRNHLVVARLGAGGRVSVDLGRHRKFKIRLVGAAADVLPQGESNYPARNYYYRGPSDRWRSTTRWERLRYRDIYPGIDLVFITKEQQLEYNFELHAGADPRQIKIRYGGQRVALDRQGNVSIGSGAQATLQQRPAAFQSNGTGTHPVDCSYTLTGHELAFEVGRYDRSRTLVIDPVVEFSTYLGGPYFDAIYAVTSDIAGNVYVTGETNSGSIPRGSLPERGSRNVWVAKLDHAGNQILYLVFLGGSSDDAGKGIAVDGAGNAYVTGLTASADFPTTSGALNRTNSGAPDAFIAKLNSLGELQYSTFLGGPGSTSGLAIAVDGTGAAYVAGQTSSGSFPTTAQVVQSRGGGGIADCFISKLNPSGSALLYSTLLGGSGLDLCAGIALDSSADAYVTGTTSSTNFPTQAPIQSNLLGTQNTFVAELNPSATALIYSTYLGGSAADNGNAVAVDATGAAYVAGCASSPDFPVTAGAFQTALLGTYDGFVAKLSTGGAALTYATFLGGSGTDTVTGIALDTLDQAVLAGYTTSSNFPVVNPTQALYAGGFDAFAAVLNNAGTALVFSTYLGGSGDDRAFGVTVTSGNQLFDAGMTASTNFPMASALQNSLSGQYDGFLSSVQYANSLILVPVLPCRVADTRGNGFTGALGPPYLAGGTSRSFPVLSSACGIPLTAQAYSLNITVFPRTGVLEFLTVWPDGSPFPNASTLNSLDGRWVANALLMPAGTEGAIDIFATNDTDMVVDINGYFALPPNSLGLAFYPLKPCRIADTRASQGFTGAFGPPTMSAGTSRSFPIQSSSCSVPAAAEVYSLNITVLPTNGNPLEFLTVWGTGNPFPTVSTLNSITGAIVANAAMVEGGAGGAISAFVTDSTDLIIDINGYFGPTGAPGGLEFFPMSPCRVADTRVGQGFTGPFGPPSLTGGNSRTFPIPLSNCPVPSWAGAFDFNVTALPSTNFLGFITAWPAGQSQPNASTLNSVTGTVVANMAIVPAGTAGGIDLFASNATDVLLDLNGYFGP